MIYFDNSATTRVSAQVASYMAASTHEDFFNPSAAYTPAVETERRVDAARARMAAFFGASPKELIFTSGGTESNNAALFGTLFGAHGKKRVITSMTEHPSVYEVCRRMEAMPDVALVCLAPDASGAIPPESLAEALTPDTALVSIMQVNNETGAINDIAAMRALLRRQAPQAVLHVDGVQAFPKLDPAPADLYSISGHKFHAPKGVGALLVRKSVRFTGGQIGGGQESGLRSGTVNAPAILAMDMAFTDYLSHREAYIAAMRAVKLRLYGNLRTLPDVLVNGPSPERGAPHILNLSFPGVRGEVLLHAVSEQGLYISTGSACSAHKAGKNRILTAMGVTGQRQEGAIRFSFCPFNTLDEADAASEILASQLCLLRRYKRR